MPKTSSETLVCMQKSENIAKVVQSRRTENISTDFLANDTSEVHEALASKHKADDNTDVASVNNNYPDGRHVKHGQPRKINNTRNHQDPSCKDHGESLALHELFDSKELRAVRRVIHVHRRVDRMEEQRRGLRCFNVKVFTHRTSKKG
ncbi:hypothetical protein JHK87_001151 [Glycine soja]|nr:hypothetical protein JHK87_001151 [Glycine soja]